MKIFLLLLLCASCSKMPSPIDPDNNIKVLHIKSTKTTNDGTPFYVVLKRIDFTQFLVEDYRTITASGLEPNESTYSFCLIPGKNKKIKIDAPVNASTAVFCLFTKPDEEWKYLIDSENELKNLSISLGRHEISNIEMW